MKIAYILAIMLVIFMVGCATTPEAPAEEADDVEVPEVPDEGAEEIEDVVDEAEDSEEVPDLDLEETKDDSGLDPAVVANWQKGCEAGNAGLCAALERYGIDTQAQDEINPAGESIEE
jgi:hypothetical protein